ncbi:MAG: hypothetical protein U0892_17540 [Pirellulales bacterium]
MHSTGSHGDVVMQLGRVIVLFVFAMLLVNRSANAVDYDQIDGMLRQMCSRGLAPTAVEICRLRALRAVEREPDRSRWTMRLMECQAQLALRSPQTDDALWQAPLDECEQYRKQYPDDPRLPWLVWQASRVELLKAQCRLAAWLAAPADDKSREAALVAVRRILSMLDELDADLGKRLPLTQSRDPNLNKQAPAKQLHELRLDGTLLRCEALALRAQAYPADSKDRIAAAGEIYRSATEVVQRAPLEWPSRDELLTAAAAAGLEIGRAGESIRVLEQIAAGSAPAVATPDGSGSMPAPPPSERARIRAASAAIEYQCRTGNAKRAANIANLFRNLFPGPESAVADIRVQLALLPDRGAAEREGELQKIIEMTKGVGQQYGDYWQRRAEALLVESAIKSPDRVTQPEMSNNPNNKPNTDTTSPSNQLAKDLVLAEVKQLLAAGKTAAAAEKLKTASETALVAGRKPQALEFALQAAAVMQKEQEWLRAADVLEKTTVADPTTAGSAAAHAQACWLTAQALKGKPSDIALAERYERSLQAQLDLWPDDAESLEPEEWLVTWLAQRKSGDDVGLWQRRLSKCKDPANMRRALTRWLESVVTLDSRRAAQPYLDQLKSEMPKLEAIHSYAVTALITAQLMTSDMQLVDAETIVGEKLATDEPKDLSGGALELWRITAALAAASQNNTAECLAKCKEADFGLLSGPIVKAWLRSMFERVDESPIERNAALGPAILCAPAWESLPKSNKDSASLQATAWRFRLLQAALDNSPLEKLTELNAGLEKLVAANTRDARTVLLAAGAEAAHFADKKAHAMRLVQQIAVAEAGQGEYAMRARMLEILWLRAAGESGKAAELAAQTSATREISQAWYRKILDTMIPKR